MATVAELVDAKELHPIGGSRREPVPNPRRFYATTPCAAWLDNINRNNPASPDGLEESPRLQLFGILKTFINRGEMRLDREFHPMRPGEKNIWEITTAELRIFGFFSEMDEFIAVVADYKSRIITYSLYPTYRQMVENFRSAHQVNYVRQNGVAYVLS
ncbi:hypothetical protein [Methylobacterium phyllosphaerae]